MRDFKFTHLWYRETVALVIRASYRWLLVMTRELVGQDDQQQGQYLPVGCLFWLGFIYRCCNVCNVSTNGPSCQVFGLRMAIINSCRLHKVPTGFVCSSGGTGPTYGCAAGSHSFRMKMTMSNRRWAICSCEVSCYMIVPALVSVTWVDYDAWSLHQRANWYCRRAEILAAETIVTMAKMSTSVVLISWSWIGWRKGCGDAQGHEANDDPWRR